MARLIPILACAGVLAGACVAQARQADVTAAQISSPERGAAAVAPPPEVSTSPRLSAGVRGRADLVTTGGPLSEGRHSAEAAPELSTRAEGRAVATAPVGGRDRCDVEYPHAASEACSRKIEARAGEYGKPKPAPVTSEARLMILSDPPAPEGIDATTRRLGSDAGIDGLAGSAAQALAGALQTGQAATTAPDPTAGSTPSDLPSSMVAEASLGPPKRGPD